MAIHTTKVFEWVGAIAGLFAIVAGLYAAYEFLAKDSPTSLAQYFGEYSGSAEGYDFVLGIQMIGGNKVIGEIDFDGWSSVEVQLEGDYETETGILNLNYRRNANHPSGPDKGKVIISYDSEIEKFTGYWKSDIEAGNEQIWVLNKTKDEYKVTSWDG